jgi:predicted nucleic acid-binding protein
LPGCEKRAKKFGGKKLDFVLDSNIFIFAFDVPGKAACVELVNFLLQHRGTHSHHVHIPRLILKEIRRNLNPRLLQDAMKAMHQLAIPDEDFVIPYKIGEKYRARGLKPADALIAAYAEWAEADFLVSQNRHFLSQQANLPFKIVTAQQCLKLFK